MRIAVFSDIHSNTPALRACIHEAEKQKADLWLFLGDYVSDCANPDVTMELIRKVMQEHTCCLIKGNREEYLLNYRQNGGDWCYGSTTGSLLYTYEHLSEEDMCFFDSLPITDVVRIEGMDPIRICHGSPKKTREKVEAGNGMAEKLLAQIDEPVLLGGHSHKQFFEYWNGKLYVNPGSLGIPTSGIPQAEMAFLESDGHRWMPKLIRVPYDIEETVREIEKADLPRLTLVWANCIIKALRTARNFPIECLELAEKLAGGVPENEHYVEAAKMLGIIS